MRANAHRATGRRHRRAAKDTGRTNWRRFTLAGIGALVTAAGTIAATTAAAVPVSFAVSGSPFIVRAERLEATSAVQFPSFRQDATGRQRPVAAVGIQQARIYRLCQSAVARTPLGTATLQIRSGSDEPVQVDALAIDLSRLSGDMTYRHVEMGRDASTLRAAGVSGTPGTYGQHARTLTIKNMRLKAWSLTAGMFALTDASMSVKAGEQPCR